MPRIIIFRTAFLNFDFWKEKNKRKRAMSIIVGVSIMMMDILPYKAICVTLIYSYIIRTNQRAVYKYRPRSPARPIDRMLDNRDCHN